MTCKHLHKDAPENAVCEDCDKLKTLKDLEKKLLNIGRKVYENLHRSLPKYHKINSAQDKILNDINLAIDETIEEFSNLLLKEIREDLE